MSTQYRAFLCIVIVVATSLVALFAQRYLSAQSQPNLTVISKQLSPPPFGHNRLENIVEVQNEQGLYLIWTESISTTAPGAALLLHSIPDGSPIQLSDAAGLNYLNSDFITDASDNDVCVTWVSTTGDVYFWRYSTQIAQLIVPNNPSDAFFELEALNCSDTDNGIVAYRSGEDDHSESVYVWEEEADNISQLSHLIGVNEVVGVHAATVDETMFLAWDGSEINSWRSDTGMTQTVSTGFDQILSIELSQQGEGFVHYRAPGFFGDNDYVWRSSTNTATLLGAGNQIDMIYDKWDDEIYVAVARGGNDDGNLYNLSTNVTYTLPANIREFETLISADGDLNLLFGTSGFPSVLAVWREATQNVTEITANHVDLFDTDWVIEETTKELSVVYQIDMSFATWHEGGGTQALPNLTANSDGLGIPPSLALDDSGERHIVYFGGKHYWNSITGTAILITSPDIETYLSYYHRIKQPSLFFDKHGILHFVNAFRLDDQDQTTLDDKVVWWNSQNGEQILTSVSQSNELTGGIVTGADGTVYVYFAKDAAKLYLTYFNEPNHAIYLPLLTSQ